MILVVNKTDRPDARIDEVVHESQDLLLDLAGDLEDEEASQAAELALDLPAVLYASGRAGVASMTQPADGSVPDGDNLDPFFDVLMEHVPAPRAIPKPAAGPRHQPRRLGLPRPPRPCPHPQRDAAQGPAGVVVPRGRR